MSEVSLPPATGTIASWVPLPRTPPRSPLDHWSLPGKQGPALGEPCISGAEQQPQQPQSQAVSPAVAMHTLCGTQQRISVEERPHALWPGEPAPPCELRAVPSATDHTAFSTRACVSGDHLLIVSACHMCRALDAGNVVHARLSELTLAQHDRLHLQVGLRPGAGPRSPEAWRALLAQPD